MSRFLYFYLLIINKLQYYEQNTYNFVKKGKRFLVVLYFLIIYSIIVP